VADRSEAPRSLPVDTPAGPVADRVLPRRVIVTEGVFSHADWSRLPVRLFLRDQVVRLSMASEVSLHAQFAFRAIGAGVTAWQRHEDGPRASLLPFLKPYDRFVGARELLVKAKQARGRGRGGPRRSTTRRRATADTD